MTNVALYGMLLFAALVVLSCGTDAVSSGSGECGTKTTCSEMSSCSEARHFLSSCGLSRLDGDNDGTPCESLCK